MSKLRITGAALGVAALATAATLFGPFPPTSTADAQVEARRGTTFAVDQVHSSVLFSVKYMNSSYFFGRFNEFSGSFLIDPDKPGASFIDITIDATSVDSGHDGRDGHLKGPDFFNTAQYKTATFKSTSAERVDDDTLAITGNFTARGVTNEITVEVDLVGVTTDPRANKMRQGFMCKFTFDRLDYGISYGPQALSADTDMIISITGLEQ
jgi:polyisoprenoid-binding protein YceI